MQSHPNTLARTDPSVVIVALLGAAVIATAATLVQQPLLVLSASLLAVVCLLGLWHPYRVVALTGLIGVVGAYYIGTKVSFIPLELNGPLVMAVLFLVCGASVVAREIRDPGVNRFQAAAVVLLCVWLLAPLGIADPVAATTPAGLVLGLSGTDVLVALGVLAVCSSQRGRVAVLWSLTIAGIGATAVAVPEFLMRENFILAVGTSLGAGEEWVDLPLRFGLHRVAGAFGHPIILGTFLGLSMLATLELARRKVLSEAWAVAIIGLELMALTMTLSRGPLIAAVGVLALWAVVARPMHTWRRAVLLIVIAACFGLTFWQLGMESDVSSFMAPSESELGQASQHRVGLLRAFFDQLPQAPVFGYGDPKNLHIVRSFGNTIDNQGLWLLLVRGTVGLAVFTALVCLPAMLALVQSARPPTAKLFPVLVTTFLILNGSSVAYFGQIVPYLFAVVALLWTMLGERFDAPADAERGEPGV